ncbi:MAG: DNA polymerase III subunit alpha [Erysipelotrichaceae bacterium]|nr:DNA polymerase III subunit alpha [Erysipelotrichaceae bacterium]
MSSPLFIRSVHSCLNSMCKIEDIVNSGLKYGYKALGLVDINVLSGSMNFYKACKKNNIKAVFGLEFFVENDGRKQDVVMYAKDDEGFKNLMGLSSYICTHEYGPVSIEELNKYRNHNILCLLSDDMPLTYALDKQLDIQQALRKQNDLFSEYIVGLVDHNIAMNKSRDVEIKRILNDNNIFTFALNRTFFINKEDKEVYDILKCIRDKRMISEPDNSDDSGRYLLSSDEMRTLYDEDDIININKLVEMCNVDLAYKTTLPKYQCKNGVSSKEFLTSLCKVGLSKRLQGKISQAYSKRLEYELSIITKMHFEDYFLIVYDFILYAKKNNILVGPARGSAGGSLVAYCLGITEIDPLKYGLIFERFLNPERISMPDIDTDFPDDKRDEVIRYVRDKYGIEHVGHIVTYGTLKAKQVLRDVGKVLNYSTNEIDSLCKLVPNASDITLDYTYNNVSLFKQRIEADSKYRKLFAIAKKLEGNPRQHSTHAAGIVMSDKPFNEVVPVMSIEDDIYSTQYTMEHLEEMGLIKMDFLGLRNLSIIAEIVDDINTVENFDIKKIPLDDQKTYKLIDDVNVLGVFQLESSGMQNLIRKMKPKYFEEIGMTIALFRPGPMENIPVFLENRARPDKITYLDKSLEPILKETYGVIVYQEQIMDIARSVAGFSYGKADVLRKAMSKKKASELEKLYPDFIAGCKNNGYSEELGNKIYELIMKFANYGFNKSHSIAYGLIAYQMAYLKANYPLYFYKALLNGSIGAEGKTYDYLCECMNIGQKVKGISMNKSELTYAIKDDAIILPFTVCKDVGSISANKIIEERNHGPYLDYIDSVCRLVRVGVDKGVITNLIYAGAFDEFNQSRHTMIEYLENVLMYANAHKNEISILDNDDVPLIKELKDDYMVLAENEKKVLGFYFSYNPIASLKKKYNINCDNLYNLANTSGYVNGFGEIKRVKSLKTKKGDDMAFVDLIDDKGELSLAIMPDLYRNIGGQLAKDKYVTFEGKIERQGSCLVRKITIL